MTRKLFVSIPEFHNQKSRIIAPPQNFEDMIERLARPGGFWQVKQVDKRSGEVIAEQWLENAYSDNGVSAMFKQLAGASTPTTVPGSYIAIDQSIGATSLTAGIASGGTVTSISVAAPTGPSIPSGTKLLINAGNATTLLVTTTQAITTAQTCTVSSVPGPSSAIASGAPIRYDYTAVPTADPSSLAAPVSYTSSLPAGQFTYTLTTGYGNRQLQITTGTTYQFLTPGATTANYTGAWLTSASPISTTSQTFLHCAFDSPLVINSSNNGIVTIVEKL